jgi:hypothetical protein
MPTSNGDRTLVLRVAKVAPNRASRGAFVKGHQDLPVGGQWLCPQAGIEAAEGIVDYLYDSNIYNDSGVGPAARAAASTRPTTGGDDV